MCVLLSKGVSESLTYTGLPEVREGGSVMCEGRAGQGTGRGKGQDGEQEGVNRWIEDV